MSSDERPIVPKWFMSVAVVAVLWNLMGLMAFSASVAIQFATTESMATEDLTITNLPDAQRELLQSTPTWATAAFAVAVICGTAGSLLLSFKKKAAVAVLWLSLLGVLVQNTHGFFMSKTLEVYGPQSVVLPIVVVVVAIALVVVATRADREGWLT